jgi:peptidoglycan biosynthesis protein MviN/MurJ (putative lipid II flippase)
MVPFLMASSKTICDILYNKGNIDTVQLNKISSLIAANSISMISIFIYIILGLILLSSGMGKRYATLGVVAQAVLIISNLVLSRKLGVYTFVCSTILAHTIASVFMFFSLPFSKRETGFTILKYLSAIIAVSAIAVYFNQFIYHPVNSYLNILFNGCLILSITFIIASILKIEEVDNVRRVILSKIAK